MMKKLMSNMSLKLMSVVVGIVVWLLVVNINDPIVSRTIPGVTVEIKNESYVESANLMCLVEENQDIISVTVKGKRSVVDNVKPEDITAEADLTQIVDMNTTPVMVPITVSCPGITRDNISPNPENMSISLDNMKTQEFIITVSSEETTPAKGYEVGSLQADREKVKITGPQSLIQKIDKVVAPINVSDLTADTTRSSDLSIIDKNQEELTERQMAYLKYDITNPKVNVAVDLWKVRNDVSLQAGYTGYAADGFKIEKISLTPNVLSVAGNDDALAALTVNENVIQIPDEYIVVSGEDEDFETKINVEDLLPEGIKLTTGSSQTVIATVSILPQNSQEYSIPTTGIQALNVPEGLRVVYETDGILVRVREGSQDLSTLTDSSIKASIDFSGKNAGTYDMPVNIALPDGYELVEGVTTAVKLVQDAEVGSTD